MAERLNGGVINLSQGQYEFAQSVLGEGFGQDYERYVNVAGETDTTQDDRVAETFNETRTTQRTYVEKVQEFRDTYEEYREAKAANETERARRLARKLDRIASDINESGEKLAREFETLSNQTGASLDQGQATIENLTSNITSTTETLVDETLVETDLQISYVSAFGSFREPLLIKGRFVTSDGEPIANSSIRLAVPSNPRTTTNSDGEFILRYRPTAIQTGNRSLDVRATPRNTSQYRSATLPITAEIRSVNASLTLSAVPDRVGYGDDVTITANVTVDGRPVPGIPVVVKLGGRTLAEEITSNGSVQLAKPLPASIDDGTANMRVTIPWEHRAISSVSVERSLQIEATPTQLSITAQNGSAIRVTGALETEDGRPILNQPVSIYANDRVATTVETHANGSFATSLGGDAIPDGEEVTLSARFDEPTSNLDGSQAHTVAKQLAELSQKNSGTPGSGIRNPFSPSDSGSLIWLLAGGLFVLLAAGAALIYRRRSRPEPAIAMEDESLDSPNSEPEPESGYPSISEVTTALRDADGNTAAIALYQLLIEEFAVDNRSNTTHWERYQAASETLSTKEMEIFEEATELYEQASYAPSDVSMQVAKSVFQRATAVIIDEQEPKSVEIID